MTLGSWTGSSFCTKKGQSQTKGVIGKEWKGTLDFCPSSHALEGVGEPGTGSRKRSSFSATPFTYQPSKRGGAVHSNGDHFPQQAIQGLCKAQTKFGYEREHFFNCLKANLARNTTVPFDLQKDLLPELWQNPETAVDNKNLPIQLATQPDESFQPYGKMKQLPSESLVTFVEQLTRAIELRVKNEGAQEQVLEEMALANANERCKAAILSLSIEPAPTLHDMLQVCARKIPFIKARQNTIPESSHHKKLLLQTPCLLPLCHGHRPREEQRVSCAIRLDIGYLNAL
ncbi:hypothetical protein DUI87_00171 [Hirundo rustica rustica]|uniref:Retroviral nucleocapsid Gag protein p24 C-terminal domain-containing protein n=1 Tax=Hirundo rustica rustica TaxID=333673 RepID=A0A3M0LFN2_HIRRU|nr:hypothetical protein DUI87_00171 [Hirundo rustica rustica]